MMHKYKIITPIFIALFLVAMSNRVSAQTFRDICEGNGEFIQNVRITSVMIMGAEHNRNLYIATNNSNDWIATKHYDESNKPSDRVLVDAVVKANILKSYVDLCVTGRAKELYGINLK